MYKNKKTGIVGIIITIIVLIIIVILSNTDIKKVSFVENIFSSIVMPIQNGLTYLKNKIEGNDSFFTDVKNLQAENDELKKKNSELEQSLRELEIIKSENETLKEYVNLKDKYLEYKTLPAYIINKNINNGVASSGFIHIRVKDNLINPRFLYYFLTSHNNISLYSAIAESSQTTIPSFNKDVIENLELPDISVSKQLLIVDIIAYLKFLLLSLLILDFLLINLLVHLIQF